MTRFDPATYGPAIAGVLSLDGDGARLIPLVAAPQAAIAAAAQQIQPGLFAKSAHPAGALAGLWTYFSFFDQGHTVAQEDHSIEGSYWHAILHRQEPDAFNSAYWFRRVRNHAIYQPLAKAAEQIAERNLGCGFRVGTVWDPQAFIDYCESSAQAPGSIQEQTALEIQRAEWQLLFDHCARRATD